MRKKGAGHQSNITKGLAMGLFVSLMVTTVICLITACLVISEKLSEEHMKYGAAMALLIGSFIGAWTAAQLVGVKRIIICLMSGVFYFVFLLCVTAIAFEGMYKNIWPTFLVIAGGSIAAGLAGIRNKSTTYKKHKVYAHR